MTLLNTNQYKPEEGQSISTSFAHNSVCGSNEQSLYTQEQQPKVSYSNSQHNISLSPLNQVILEILAITKISSVFGVKHKQHYSSILEFSLFSCLLFHFLFCFSIFLSFLCILM
jgi:hypothetical protein